MNNLKENRKNSDASFCRACALKSFKIWKGWIARDARNWKDDRRRQAYLPELPELTAGRECIVCGGSEIVSANQIFYKNFHNEFSTGLPDYFHLIIDDRTIEQIDHNLIKWELPYIGKPLGLIPLEKLADHVNEFYGNSG